MRLFWSYQLWFEGNWEQGRAILANIAMLIPFGFLAAAIRACAGRKRLLPVVLMGLIFSALIETVQRTLMRGSFEFDDICNNAAGALLGTGLFWLGRRLLSGRPLRAVLLSVGAGVILFCFGLAVWAGDGESGSLMPLSQGLCFQVEQAAVHGEKVELSGVCFWYDGGPDNYTICLRNTRTGKSYPLQTERGLPRPDVTAYFVLDRPDAGFRAAGQELEAGEEYEIMLDFGFFRVIPTGVYLTARDAGAGQPYADLSYVPNADFQPPETAGTALEEIVSNGTLRAYNPAYHVYVYCYEGSLYWIAGEGFLFEADGSTRLELYLWTTEADKLSEKSRASGLSYDFFGVYFEKNELTGDFGKYRVCVQALPSLYPIASIRTGYYSNGWVWQENFWPVFDFSQ